VILTPVSLLIFGTFHFFLCLYFLSDLETSRVLYLVFRYPFTSVPGLLSIVFQSCLGCDNMPVVI